MEPRNVKHAVERVCDRTGWACVEDGTGVAIVVPLTHARRQIVYVETMDPGEDAQLRLHTQIGDADVLSEFGMRGALSLNSQLRHGSIAIRDGQLALTETVAADISLDWLERVLRYLADNADFYEHKLFGYDDH